MNEDKNVLDEVFIIEAVVSIYPLIEGRSKFNIIFISYTLPILYMSWVKNKEVTLHYEDM